MPFRPIVHRGLPFGRYMLSKATRTRRSFPPPPKLLDAGMELLSRRADKRWSLTDCISFVVMERHGLTEAVTADRHFEQAGFRALLLHEPPDPA